VSFWHPPVRAGHALLSARVLQSNLVSHTKYRNRGAALHATSHACVTVCEAGQYVTLISE